MKIRFEGGNAFISGQSISVPVIFTCGQAFRFEPEGGGYTGVAHGRVLHAENEADGALVLYDVTPEEFNHIWRHYFDLDRDYAAAIASFSDKTICRCAETCVGMRLLNQEPFETVISFIVSANNNIPRIKGIISRLCEHWGKPLMDGHFAFPSPKRLAEASEEELKGIGLGYRAPYIEKASKLLADGALLEHVAALPDEEAKRELMALPGVGPKVADCVLLFAFDRKSAFPKDVWIRRALEQLYGVYSKSDRELDAFAAEHFGELRGLAQQYIYYSMINGTGNTKSMDR